MSENQINWAREIADEKRRDRIRDLERELAAMTAAKELAERQVAVLADTLAHPVQRYPFGAMAWTTDQWAAWSRAEAMEGGKG